MELIYLDYNATTPVDRQVADEMIPYITEFFGNPSSTHKYGVKAKMAVEKAREQVAMMINCHPDEIVFTGGGTESNNLAIKGAAYANKHKGNHIIISAVEHPAVTEVVQYLGLHGYDISVAKVDSTGMVDPKEIEALIRPATVLISLMHANNEVGTIQPVKEVAAIAHKHGIIIHTDAAQSAGKIKVDVADLDVDLLSLAGHKLYAPKGIGALYIRRGTKIEKFMHGANHENDLRAGTENVPYIVALGKACELITLNLDEYAGRMLSAKKKLTDGLKALFPDMRINGHSEMSLPNTLNVSFKNLGAGDIMAKLDGLAVSAGAACHSSSGKSGTLEAMNLPAEYALGAMRISTGRHTSIDEINKAVQLIADAAGGMKDNVNHAFHRITEYAHGLGCGCKMKAVDLEYILKDLPQVKVPDVIVSASDRDDAAVYRITQDEAIVQTVDFFTPLVDDPYAFGAIAAANALGDIYAMGAEPLFALNLVAFPVDKLPLDVLREIMRGATEKATEAGIPILGGHSIEDDGIKFGMVVTGRVKTKNLITNAGARPGDKLILTKPIGSGVMTKASSMGLIEVADLDETIKVMSALNKDAAKVMSRFEVNACTDITGFGLVGHLHEITLASSVEAVLYYDKIPIITNAEKMAVLGAISGSSRSNEAFAANHADFTTLNVVQRSIVCDAQTSGGLLISIPGNRVAELLHEMSAHGINAAIIGEVTNEGKGKITIEFSR